MSWYTAAEIVVWLLIAAVLGFVLGWLLRGILSQVRRDSTDADDPETKKPARKKTSVLDVDTGASHTGSAPVDSRFAPAQDSDDPRSRLSEIAKRTGGDGNIPRDDLARIHGVGPKLAKLLDSMGITSFRQIARLTPSDVTVVNDALEGFPGRIERDDWMSSARELHREVYGTEP